MDGRPQRILCVGDLNADITITPSGSVRVGSDTAGRVSLSGGGSAANVACWAARAGIPSRFAGVVGDDSLGDILVDGLHDERVETCVIRRSGSTSRAIAAIVDPNGERSLVSDLDTATTLRAGDLDSTWLNEVGWMHLTAYTYFPITSRPAFMRLRSEATGRCIPWSVDPSSAEMLRALCDRDEVIGSLHGAAAIFSSRDEAAWLSGRDDPVTAAEALLDVAATVAVTCGADGAEVVSRSSPAFHVDAVDGPIVNTLGCGDAFAAGFIAARLRGLDDIDAAHSAAVAAGAALALASAR